MDSKIYGFFGLAKRAGKTVLGIDGIINSVRYGKSKLVILAQDASENTKKQITDKCTFYNVPLIVFGDKESLAKSMGTENAAAVSVIDKNFADALMKKLENI